MSLPGTTREGSEFLSGMARRRVNLRPTKELRSCLDNSGRHGGAGVNAFDNGKD